MFADAIFFWDAVVANFDCFIAWFFGYEAGGSDSEEYQSSSVG